MKNCFGEKIQKITMAITLTLGIWIFVILIPSYAEAINFQTGYYLHIEGYAQVSGFEWTGETDEDGNFIYVPHNYSDSFNESSGGPGYLSDSVEIWPSYASAESWASDLSGNIYAYGRDGFYGGIMGDWEGPGWALAQVEGTFITTDRYLWAFNSTPTFNLTFNSKDAIQNA
jgi:hypothetical protein